MLKVRLAFTGDPDWGLDPYTYLVGPEYGIADSIPACRSLVKAFVQAHSDLLGDWAGGHVFEGGNYIGWISQNGKFWPKGQHYADETYRLHRNELRSEGF